MSEWQTYREGSGFGKGVTVVTQDNIEASQARYEALKAAERNRATPEQLALLRDADAAINRGLEQES